MMLMEKFIFFIWFTGNIGYGENELKLYAIDSSGNISFANTKVILVE